MTQGLVPDNLLIGGIFGIIVFAILEKLKLSIEKELNEMRMMVYTLKK